MEERGKHLESELALMPAYDQGLKAETGASGFPLLPLAGGRAPRKPQAS
jgi:hypothetical protein